MRAVPSGASWSRLLTRSGPSLFDLRGAGVCSALLRFFSGISLGVFAPRTCCGSAGVRAIVTFDFRSRLPKGTWERPFKLTKKSGGDNQLPIAHTCFFQVGLGGWVVVWVVFH